jgi:ABC-type multidrug transport system fused ATPase/permease subunit
VLLLDEPTSALDTSSEAGIVALLQPIAAARRRTLVVVAHRLSTVRAADRTVVFEDGHVVATPVRARLLVETPSPVPSTPPSEDAPWG